MFKWTYWFSIIDYSCFTFYVPNCWKNNPFKFEIDRTILTCFNERTELSVADRRTNWPQLYKSLGFKELTLPEECVTVYLLFCIELFTSEIGGRCWREGRPANLGNYIQVEQALVITGRIFALVVTVLLKKRKYFKQKFIVSF